MRKFFSAMAPVMVLFCATATADVVVSGTGKFQTGVAPNNQNGPYWDNRSNDGRYCNIGYVLNGTATPSQCSSDIGLPVVNPNSPNLAYWANSSSENGYDPSFYFTHDAASTLVLKAKNTAAEFDEFGYYTFVNGNPNGAINMVPLFTTTSADEQTAIMPATASPFGFYFRSRFDEDIAGTLTYNFFTQSSRNFCEDKSSGRSGADCADPTAGRGTQQFALFRVQPAGTAGKDAFDYYLGMEDRVGAQFDYDGDYNDFVVRVTSIAPVPEPASVVLFGTVLAGAGLLLRRLRNR